ncbi:MAG: glycosyltransferase family 4 protein [Ardenticatenales bacterium]
MRIALVVPYYDPRLGGDVAGALWRFPTVPELAGALAARGHSVAAFHLARRSGTATWAGVPHRFVATGPLRRSVARAVWRRVPRFGSPYFEPAVELAAQAVAWRPDVVHVFGLTVDGNLALVARFAAAAGVPIVVHFHGGVPAEDRWTRTVLRATLRRVARVLFTEPEQAAPWRQAGLLRPEQIAIVTETSTRMSPVRDPASAARLPGHPSCVAIGRLHPLKDYPTLFAAFARVVQELPEARLHLFYGSEANPCRLPVLVQAVPELSKRVVFHGYTKSAGVAAALGGADIFVQASRREWSSLSVLEALAVGCPAVLSDIPSFRALSGDGRCARLVAVGDAAAFADAIIGLARSPAARAHLAAAGKGWFESRLSFEAIARDLEGVYRSLEPITAGQRPAG